MRYKESVSSSVNNMQSLNNCTNRAVCKMFGARTAKCAKDIKHYGGFHDVAKLFEGRRMRFMDSLIHCGRYVDLFSSFSHC